MSKEQSGLFWVIGVILIIVIIILIITITLEGNYTSSDEIRIELISPNKEYISFFDENNKEIPDSTIISGVSSNIPTKPKNKYKIKIFAKKDDWQDSYIATMRIIEKNKNLEKTFNINVS